MVVVFLSFVLGANVSVKQVGLGLAVAVLIDARLVRLVLVPAVMELLGPGQLVAAGPLARILPADGPGRRMSPRPGPAAPGRADAPERRRPARRCCPPRPGRALSSGHS